MFAKDTSRKYAKNPSELSLLVTRRGSRNRPNRNLFLEVMIRVIGEVELGKRHSFSGLIVEL